jgi:hypothetical protein
MTRPSQACGAPADWQANESPYSALCLLHALLWRGTRTSLRTSRTCQSTDPLPVEKGSSS